MSCVVVQVPSLRDNYSYLLHDVASGATAIIDATGGAPVRTALDELGWTLSHVLCTHHHHDHTGGNLDLGGPGVTIIGAANDADRIPGIQQHVDEGETFYIGQTPLHVWHTPGHTTGHICFLVDEVEYEGKTSPAVFVGDTLFAMGCGRLFEGSAQQMWRSLRRLGDLPKETRIFCAHEYTESNGRFALRVDPDNDELVTRMDTVAALRRQGIPTVPTTVALENATNPFLRADQPALRAAVALPDGDPSEVFGRLRKQKDIS